MVRALPRRFATLVPLVVVLSVWYSYPAFAECHGSVASNSGSGTTGVGPTSSSQTMTWNYGDRRAAATAQNSDETETSYCIDATTDWLTSSGHYDARVARNCDATGVTIATGARPEPSGWGSRDVNGLQKAFSCFYNQTSTPGIYSGCVYLAAGLAGCVHDGAQIWSHASHEVWLRRQDGTPEHNDGGVVSSWTN